jgi:hypothetical protein
MLLKVSKQGGDKVLDLEELFLFSIALAGVRVLYESGKIC